MQSPKTLVIRFMWQCAFWGFLNAKELGLQKNLYNIVFMYAGNKLWLENQCLQFNIASK